MVGAPPRRPSPRGLGVRAGGTGAFVPREWTDTFWACDTFPVAVGTWIPGTIPPELELDDPLPGMSHRGWAWWGLNDPAEVWHGSVRPEELGAALSGLSRDAREAARTELPPGLEIDPEVPWIREALRLGASWEDSTLELVGRFRGAVRLRGGGASSPAVFHFWARWRDGERSLRYGLLDLPEAGAGRLSRRLVGALRAPGATEPSAIFRETSEAGRRVTVMELLPSGRFQTVLRSPWVGCGAP